MAASAGDIGPTAGMAAARQYENYYEYDAAGNRTLLRHGETDAEDLAYYAYDAANELTSLHAAAGWTYFAYDQNGNTVMEQAPGYTRYFDWDGRDMLVGVRSNDQGWTDNVYRYDGLASRVSTLESSGLTYYDWDSINVIQEKDADGDVTDRQVHGYAPIFSVGDIALMDKSGTPYVPVSDQVGTTWNLLNSAAAKANCYAYDAFGVARSVSETASNLYRFGTKRLDIDGSLYHFIARQYVAPLGQFLRKDIWVQNLARGEHAAFSGRPLAVTDPSGMLTTDTERIGPLPIVGEDPGIPGIWWPHVPTPADLLKALGKCGGAAATAWFEEQLAHALSGACSIVRQSCEQQGPPKLNPECGGPRRGHGTLSLSAPSFRPGSSGPAFAKCMANEFVGSFVPVRIFSDSGEVAWFSDAIYNWLCEDNPSGKSIWVIVRASVAGKWVSLGSHECDKDTWKACCLSAASARSPRHG